MRSLIFQPIMLLIIGPPVWRLVDSRDALASLEGETDIWIIVQVLVYALAGLLSFAGLIEYKKQLINNKKLSIFFFVCLGLCFSLYLSCFNSPSPVLTFTYSSFYLIGIFSSIYFILKCNFCNNIILDYFCLLRSICFMLLIFVAISSLINIQFVGYESDIFGLRILGGRVASSGISALLLYTISLYFLTIGYKSSFRSIIFIIFGLIFIYFSKTRSIYFLTIAITYSIFIVSLFNKSSRIPFLLKPVFYFILPTLIISNLLFFIDAQSVIYFLIRYNLDSFKNFGGRLSISKWTIDRLLVDPWGLGYVAGFRNIFLFQGQINDVITQRIGTTHNSYLEIMIGAGWHALFFYLLILGTSIKNFIKVLRMKYIDDDIKNSNQLGFLLLGLILTLALIDSKFVLPTRNEFGYFWYTIGLSFIIYEKALSQNRLGLFHNIKNS